MSRVKFKEAIGPGKCTRCGIYIHGDERMWTAENLSGRPSLIKQQENGPALQPIRRDVVKR